MRLYCRIRRERHSRPMQGITRRGWQDGRLGDLKHPGGVNNIGLANTNQAEKKLSFRTEKNQSVHLME